MAFCSASVICIVMTVDASHRRVLPLLSAGLVTGGEEDDDWTSFTLESLALRMSAEAAN